MIQKRKVSDINPNHRSDGKSPAQRRDAAIKAAKTRKKRRGDLSAYTFDVSTKFLREFEEKVVERGSYHSTSEAIRDGMRRLLTQWR